MVLIVASSYRTPIIPMIAKIMFTTCTVTINLVIQVSGAMATRSHASVETAPIQHHLTGASQRVHRVKEKTLLKVMNYKYATK
jgi:hypothetical protein